MYFRKLTLVVWGDSGGQLENTDKTGPGNGEGDGAHNQDEAPQNADKNIEKERISKIPALPKHHASYD